MKKMILGLTLALSSSMGASPKVLSFAGSTRKDSYNKKLVIEASKMAHQMGAEVTIVDLADAPIPFYDSDLEATEGMPERAREMRKLMLDCDVVFIASPEYNSSITAVLKNTLDWISRGEEGGGSLEPFKDRTFAIMGASPGKLGASRSLIHLRSILENVGGKVVPLQVTIPRCHTVFDEEGNLTNETKKQELRALVKQALG